MSLTEKTPDGNSQLLGSRGRVHALTLVLHITGVLRVAGLGAATGSLAVCELTRCRITAGRPMRRERPLAAPASSHWGLGLWRRLGRRGVLACWRGGVLAAGGGGTSIAPGTLGAAAPRAGGVVGCAGWRRRDLDRCGACGRRARRNLWGLHLADVTPCEGGVALKPPDVRRFQREGRHGARYVR